MGGGLDAACRITGSTSGLNRLITFVRHAATVLYNTNSVKHVCRAHTIQQSPHSHALCFPHSGGSPGT